MDGSAMRDMLQRLDEEFPEPPLFPKVTVSVDLIGDTFDRFEGIMPRFTRAHANARA